MANIKSFPNNQDVYIGAEWVMKWLHGRTSGVFGAENNLSTSVVLGSMSVEVSDGVGWLSNDKGDGIVFWNDSEQSNGSKLRLTHDVANGVLDRIDRIVVTWETTNYVSLPTISVLKGVASSNPVPPALTNNNIQRQISLARVNVPAGTVSLSPSMITDERLDPDVCGIVTETVRVDTSTMQSQFEALLTAIQKELQNLNAGTAALLKTGDTMQGILDMGENQIKNVAAPTEDGDAVPWSTVKGKLSSDVESTDYPGCYYRTVGGVTEWLNPPMALGTEYRTVERFKNKVVYVKAINFGALPDQDQKSVSTGISYSNIVSCVGHVRNTTDKIFEHLPVLNADSNAAQYYYEDKSIVVITHGVGGNYKECVFFLKYTK